MAGCKVLDLNYASSAGEWESRENSSDTHISQQVISGYVGQRVRDSLPRSTEKHEGQENRLLGVDVLISVKVYDGGAAALLAWALLIVVCTMPVSPPGGGVSDVLRVRHLGLQMLGLPMQWCKSSRKNRRTERMEREGKHGDAPLIY
jgi:hypothetical protein